MDDPINGSQEQYFPISHKFQPILLIEEMNTFWRALRCCVQWGFGCAIFERSRRGQHPNKE